MIRAGDAHESVFVEALLEKACSQSRKEAYCQIHFSGRHGLLNALLRYADYLDGDARSDLTEATKYRRQQHDFTDIGHVECKHSCRTCRVEFSADTQGAFDQLARIANGRCELLGIGRRLHATHG